MNNSKVINNVKETDETTDLPSNPTCIDSVAADVFLKQLEEITINLECDLRDAQGLHTQSTELRALLAQIRAEIDLDNGLDFTKNPELQEIIDQLENEFGIVIPCTEEKGKRVYKWTTAEANNIIENIKGQMDTLLATGEFQMMSMDRKLKMKNLIIEMLSSMLRQMAKAKSTIFGR